MNIGKYLQKGSKTISILATLMLIGAVGAIVSAGTYASVVSSQVVDASGQFLGKASDTAATPSFSWKNDTDTGMFRAAANAVGLSVGGVEKMRINVGGVGIGTNRPSRLLQVNAGTKGSVFATIDFDTESGVGTGLQIASGADSGDTYMSLQTASRGARVDAPLVLNPRGGNVGVGNDNPAALLSVGRLGTFQVDKDGNLTLGKSNLPTGITLYDEDTGAAFCVKVKSGGLIATAGACK